MPVRFQHLAMAAIVAMATAAPLPSFATTLTFDDIVSSQPFTTIPNGYGGLEWNNFNALLATNVAYEDSGYRRGLVSGNRVAFNGSGNPASGFAVSAAETFDFNSAYLTAVWNKDLNVDVLGYRHGNLLYSRSVVISDRAPTLFQFDYLDIDELKFVSYGGTNAGTGGFGTHFAMDDFTYDEAAQVPEPATLGLLGLGLAGAIVARRKRQHGKTA